MALNSELKGKLLHCVYEAYASFVDTSSFACRKGCSSCCTQSVNITALEGESILGHLDEYDEDTLRLLKVKLVGPPPTSPAYSTNQFAIMCFQGKEAADGEGSWSFEPCVFLDAGCCSIYPVRPFACRGFASTTCCAKEEAAQLPTVFISLNNTVMQIIEHIDQGNIWGNMNAVLACLLVGSQAGSRREARDSCLELLRSLPCPGFLVPPEDEKSVQAFVSLLYDREVEGKPFGKWIAARD